jgi:hypothetical protein
MTTIIQKGHDDQIHLTLMAEKHGSMKYGRSWDIISRQYRATARQWH